jgi:hypothetical protein
MNQGQTVFSQLMAHSSRFTLDRCIRRYDGNRRVKSFSCRDQYLAMTFAQLAFRESLRDIEACLGATPEGLYHMGIRGRVTRSTLADANEKRDWRIYADFAQGLISEARRLYVDEPFGLDLDRTVYALDSTTIDLCLSLFPWARFRQTKGAVKLHTLLDVAGNIPTYAWITDAKTSDVRILDLLIPEPGSIYVMDRGYVDFHRLHQLSRAKATFVIRAKKNLSFTHMRSGPNDRAAGLICDQRIRLAGVNSRAAYPEPLRRIRVRDLETGKSLVFLTNDFDLPALAVSDLYRLRWQIELFFKWIKQHLRIKAFYGTSPNAVRTQIWIAISVYVLVAIVRKRLQIERDLHTILQILSVYLFEKVPLAQVLSADAQTLKDGHNHNQLSLFDL